MIFALISTLLVIWVVMWIFFKFMYPKPPKAFFPKEGDITTPRICDFCGHELAQYRGVVEKKSSQALAQHDNTASQLETTDSKVAVSKKSNVESEQDSSKKDSSDIPDNEWFFCNFEHQASFHAGEKYQS